MIRSMTGFARSETRSPQGELLWELRSVNHRYLEVQIKLPEGFRALEPEARQVIARGVRRGKVDANLAMRMSGQRGSHGTVNMDYARQIITQAEELGRAMQRPAPLSPMAVLGWPGVLEQEETKLDSLFPAALTGLERAVDELAASRAREGARIGDLLEARCAEISAGVVALRQRLPQVLAEIRVRLTERVRTLAANADPDRLEQELALLAQKLDVSEELDRLQAHVSEFRDTMHKNTEPAGRRLDFLLQEFNREANTLASKSADAETTRQAVDLKVLIEQMREQVQNVE
jgi:uncharacterized protein (TIGR00255 family)